MTNTTDTLAALKAFRRPARSDAAPKVSDAPAMQAVAAELREVLVDIDECHAAGASIAGGLANAHTLVNILDRMSGLDPKRLLDE